MPVFNPDLQNNPQGMFDLVVAQFQSLAQQWATGVYPYARGLFMALASISIVWFFLRYVLERDDPRNLVSSFLRTMLGIYFFLLLLTNGPTWMSLFVQSMEKLGAQVTGIDRLSPSALMAQGATISVKMLSSISFWDASISAGLFTSFAALMTFGAFLVMAFQMLVTAIEAALILGPGVIVLAFGGSKWTTRLTQGYIDYAISAGVRLFLIYLFAAVGVGIGDAVGNAYGALVNPSPEVMLYVAGISIIMGWLAFRVPQLGAGMINGGVAMGAGAVLTAMTIPRAAYGAAKGGGKLAAAGGAASYDGIRTKQSRKELSEQKKSFELETGASAKEYLKEKERGRRFTVDALTDKRRRDRGTQRLLQRTNRQIETLKREME